MSLKSCVVCIAGDIRQDIFAPATWEDADIERYCKQRKMTVVWEHMNKSITHLVISRAAFKSDHDAVKFVQKDRRGNEKAKIVTYDWLEDSWEAGKAIQDVSVYHPGKPRDTNAIAVACSKRRRVANCRSSDEMATPEKEGISKAFEIKQQDQTQPKTSKSSTPKPESKEKPAAAAVGKSLNSVFTQSKISKKVATSHHKKILSKQRPISASDTKTQILITDMLEKPQAQKTPNAASDLATGPSSEAKQRPRVFCDKTDEFKYSIKLTHKERPGEKWVLLLLKAPNVVDKAYLFRAYQYDAKEKINLKETNSPLSTFQKAFELFKTSFRSKMGYPWDERLVRAGNNQLGKWQYKLPGKNEPTGQVPPEFAPGHPKYVKPKDVVPAAQANPGQRPIEQNVSEVPLERRSFFPASASMNDWLINRKASKPRVTCDRAQKGKLKEVYRSKFRKSAEPISLKRRAEEFLGPANRTKVSKIAGNKFKSSEYVEDSDTGDNSPSQGPAWDRRSALLKETGQRSLSSVRRCPAKEGNTTSSKPGSRSSIASKH
ncbi:hypothetical protein N0V82_000342 [Gnomoniopsis sp. IMI 355080]|nr:hypothetical protein N0V82_000342 [Gnomoniopsis sp. IMI 355080]